MSERKDDTPNLFGTPDQDVTNLAGGPDLDTAGREGPGVRYEKHGSPTNARVADERSGAPFPTSGDSPTGDDPFVAGAPDISGGVEPSPLDPKERHAADMARHDPTGEHGPTYEANQGPNDDGTGGSTDPNNTRTLADSGYDPVESGER